MNLNDLLLMFDLFQNMFIAGILVSIICGIIGTYVVVKRLVFISGGIAHTSFGGVGLAYYLGFEPMFGAIIFSLATAISVGVGTLKAKIREDSTIGMLWAMGMALGVIFINLTKEKTNVYVPTYESILFGSIMLVRTNELYIMAGLIIIILVIVFLFFKEFLALTFDEEYAKVSGVRTGALYIVLLCLIAITVVVLIKVVGIILIIALLTIPAAISGLFTHSMKRMMIFAVIISIILTITGIIFSIETNWPSGVAIVLVSGVVFIIAIISKNVWAYLKRRGSKQRLNNY